MNFVLITLLTLGSIAPDFTLKDTISGKSVSLNEMKSDKATVVMFIANHCPFVKHVQDELAKLGNDYIPKGVTFVAISSNDIEAYPQDGPDMMKKVAKENKFPFPYLYDKDQSVAKAYNAACTPEFYIFDGGMKLVYHGQLDNSRPRSNTPVTGKDVRKALDNILDGKPVDKDQYPAVGCGIKWKD